MNVCVYSAIFGDYDTLKPHPEIEGVDWRAFVGPGVPPAEGWLTFNRPCSEDPRLAAKRYKILGPLLAPRLAGYDVTIWLDGSHEVLSPTFVAEAIDQLGGADIALYRHPWRDCIYAECEASVPLPKYAGLGDAMRAQVATYRADGHPEHGGLFATGTIVRAWSIGLDATMTDWMAECERHTVQDQLSLPVVLRRHGLEPITFDHHQVFGNPWTTIRPHADGS